MTCLRRLAPLAALLAACSRESAPPRVDSAVARAEPAASEPVPLYTQERRVDLTGDGAPERLTLVTRGGRWDSLAVRLEIRSPQDSLLYARDWRSRAYFQYDPLEGKADSTVQRIVRGQLERVLGDSAFVPRSATGPRGVRISVDTATVRYDIAEREWRRANGVGPFAELPVRASADIMEPGNSALRVPAARVDSLARELAGRPTFTYFAGGESTTTIAWSGREGRFVRVFECC